MSEPGRTPENPYTRPLGPIAAAGWSAALLIVFAVGGLVVASARPGSEYDQVNNTFLDLGSVLLVLFAIVRVHAPNGAIRDIIGARPIGFVPTLVAAFLGIAMTMPLRALDAAIGRRFPLEEAHATELVHGLTVLGARERIAGTILWVLLTPIADEVFFRGALATGIARQGGKRLALLATTLTFALIYATRGMQYAPYYLIVGLLLGHARFATGSVLAPIATSLAWGGADLAYVAWRYKTIDPLVTLAHPAYPAKVVVGSALLTVVLAALLSRFSSVDEVDPVPPQRQPLGPPGDDDQSSGDEDEGDS